MKYLARRMLHLLMRYYAVGASWFLKRELLKSFETSNCKRQNNS